MMENIKKIIIFLPLLLVAIIVIGFVAITKSFPKGHTLYILIMINILATFLLIKKKIIIRVCGVICGIMSGFYMWKISLLNWKLGNIELYIGVLFILLYLFIGIYFLISYYIIKLRR